MNIKGIGPADMVKKLRLHNDLMALTRAVIRSRSNGFEPWILLAWPGDPNGSIYTGVSISVILNLFGFEYKPPVKITIEIINKDSFKRAGGSGSYGYEIRDSGRVVHLVRFRAPPVWDETPLDDPQDWIYYEE